MSNHEANLPTPDNPIELSTRDIVCRLGIIADVQFGPSSDASNYQKTRTRRYHNSINVLECAVKTWNTLDTSDINQHTDLNQGDDFSEVNLHRQLKKYNSTHDHVDISAFTATVPLYTRLNESSASSSGLCVRYSDESSRSIDLLPSCVGNANETSVSTFHLPHKSLSCVVQLGDVIDVLNSNSSLTPVYGDGGDDAVCGSVPIGMTDTLSRTPDTHSVSLLSSTLASIDTKAPTTLNSCGALVSVFSRIALSTCVHWHHLIGNHELYNLARTQLHAVFGRNVKAGSAMAQCIAGLSDSSSGSSVVSDGVDDSDSDNYGHYYTVPLSDSYQLIVLDAYKLSLLGYTPTHEQYTQSHALVSQYNHNDLSSGDWSRGLTDEHRHFVPYNGGLGVEQLRWLDSVLTSLPTHTRAIVSCHIAAHRPATGRSTILWDHEAVLELFRQHKGKVCMYLAGHDHDGGYAYDEQSKTHHLTIAAPIEANNGQKAFGVLDLYNDSAQLIGFGKCTSRFMKFE